MAVKIIVGSTCDVEENIKKDLIVVPLHVTFGDEDFLDSVDITKDEFYERLEKKEEFPMTSQPTPVAFMDVYKETRQLLLSYLQSYRELIKVPSLQEKALKIKSL